MTKQTSPLRGGSFYAQFEIELLKLLQIWSPFWHSNLTSSSRITQSDSEPVYPTFLRRTARRTEQPQSSAFGMAVQESSFHSNSFSHQSSTGTDYNGNCRSFVHLFIVFSLSFFFFLFFCLLVYFFFQVLLEKRHSHIIVSCSKCNDVRLTAESSYRVKSVVAYIEYSIDTRVSGRTECCFTV